MLNKIKDYQKNILIFGIIILSILGAFYLGRLSQNDFSEPIKIEYIDQGASVIQAVQNSPFNTQNGSKNDPESSNRGNATTSIKGSFFASKKGKKYYPIRCSAGKSIKIENRVYFKTANEAEKAGYKISTACQ